MNIHRNNNSIALVISCTKSKRWETTPKLEFHSLPKLPVQLLAKEWLARVAESKKVYSAISLYCGPSWNAAIRASQSIENELGAVHLYFMSAGFGFLRSTDIIPSYSATFASDIDSIARKIDGTSRISEANQKWWNAIRDLRGTESAAGIAEISKNDYVIIATGRDYIEAANTDLLELAHVCKRNRLFIISVGLTRQHIDPVIQKCLLPVDIAIENILPGARSSINQRVLHWVVERVIPQSNWKRDFIDSVILQELSKCRSNILKLPVRQVVRIEDTNVKEWISNKLNLFPELSKNELLRTFRHDHSCEQKRFYRIVDSVRASMVR